jgi:hypothetical protein
MGGVEVMDGNKDDPLPGQQRENGGVITVSIG